MPQTESKSSTGAVVRCEVLPVPPALRVSLRRVSTLAFRRTHAASEDAAQHNPPPKPHAFARGRPRYETKGSALRRPGRRTCTKLAGEIETTVGTPTCVPVYWLN